MKAIYQKPTTTVFNVKIQHLMEVSLNDNGEVTNVTTAKGEYNGDPVLSRRGYSVWDDDDE